MLTTEQKQELHQLANVSLDEAERVWSQVGSQLVMLANSAHSMRKAAFSSVETRIPGYPMVDPGKPKVDHFIAIVADMRGSTKHLLCEISKSIASVSTLQRVFYETAALLPSLAKAISYESGNVTEYLGDGVLGLFCMDKEDKSKTVYAANRAAEKCLAAVRDVVNPSIHARYSLPALQVGIGMAYSKAVVTLVGLDEFLQPKVFGECVYRATKLSSGVDEIMIDEALKCLWPTAENGILQFIPKRSKEIDGYLVQKKGK